MQHDFLQTACSPAEFATVVQKCSNCIWWSLKTHHHFTKRQQKTATAVLMSAMRRKDDTAWHPGFCFDYNKSPHHDLRVSFRSVAKRDHLLHLKSGHSCHHSSARPLTQAFL